MMETNVFGTLKTQPRTTNYRNPVQVNGTLRRFWHALKILARFLSRI